MSERILAKARAGVYTRAYEAARLPPEELSNVISADFEGRFGEYYSKYGALRAVLANAPDKVRGYVWRAALKLYRRVAEGKTSTAKAEYTTYKQVLESIKGAEYLDDALKVIGVYKDIVGGGGGERKSIM